MRFLSRLVRSKDAKTSRRRAPVAGRSRRPGRRLLVEALEPRQLLSLTLTAAGQAAGFGLSTFATGFPESSNVGPLGVAFPATGGVLVSDDPGNLRLFPTDTDGQNAANIAPKNFGASNAIGLGQLNGAIYMTQQTAGDVVQLINNGASTQVIVSGIPDATAVLADPFNNLLYVDNGGKIYAVDPVAKAANVFQNISADGLSLSADGKTLYAAIRGGAFAGHVLGFDITTKAMVFDSGTISPGVDGIALGNGPVAGNLFVNTNGGTLVEVNLATTAQTIIASGGSRGDFVAVDPNNATLLVTQSDRIVRLVPGVFVITRLPTMMALTASTASATVGQSVTFIATVSDLSPGGATPDGGTVTFSDQNGVIDTEALVNGVATFTTSSLPSGTITVTASYGGTAEFAPSTSDTTVTINAPTLVIQTQPSATAIAGQPFAIQPVIYLEDQYGNLETNDNRTVVTVSLASGVGPLEGTMSVTVIDGVATFGDLTDDKAETIALDFSSGSVTTGPSTDVIVIPAPTYQLLIQTQPSREATAGQPFTVQPVVLEVDLYGNLETNDDTTAITAALATGNGPLRGTTAVTVSGGVATFTDLADNRAGVISLNFAAPSLTAGPSNNIFISPAAAAQLVIETQPNCAGDGREHADRPDRDRSRGPVRQC